MLHMNVRPACFLLVEYEATALPASELRDMAGLGDLQAESRAACPFRLSAAGLLAVSGWLVLPRIIRHNNGHVQTCVTHQVYGFGHHWQLGLFFNERLSCISHGLSSFPI